MKMNVFIVNSKKIGFESQVWELLDGLFKIQWNSNLKKKDYMNITDFEQKSTPGWLSSPNLTTEVMLINVYFKCFLRSMFRN